MIGDGRDLLASRVQVSRLEVAQRLGELRPLMTHVDALAWRMKAQMEMLYLLQDTEGVRIDFQRLRCWPRNRRRRELEAMQSGRLESAELYDGVSQSVVRDLSRPVALELRQKANREIAERTKPLRYLATYE